MLLVFTTPVQAQIQARLPVLVDSVSGNPDNSHAWVAWVTNIKAAVITIVDSLKPREMLLLVMPLGVSSSMRVSGVFSV